MGLAICATGCSRVVDEMFMAAGLALREVSPALKDPQASLLPRLEDMRTVSMHIAKAVAQEAIQQGIADEISADEIEDRLKKVMWVPEYRSVVAAS